VAERVGNAIRLQIGRDGTRRVSHREFPEDAADNHGLGLIDLAFAPKLENRVVVLWRRNACRRRFTDFEQEFVLEQSATSTTIMPLGRSAPLTISLTCLSGLCRASDSRSRPQAAKRGRGSARLYGMALVRPACLQADKAFLSRRAMSQNIYCTKPLSRLRCWHSIIGG